MRAEQLKKRVSQLEQRMGSAGMVIVECWLNDRETDLPKLEEEFYSKYGPQEGRLVVFITKWFREQGVPRIEKVTFSEEQA